MDRIISKEELGKLLRQRRKELGLTQGQVADLAAISLMSISALENGKTSVQFDKLIKILNILSLNLYLGAR